MLARIHPTAEVAEGAVIGEETVLWNHVQIREGARIGRWCTIGKGAYIDTNVSIGDNVKIQNYASLYAGLVVEDGVFIGPHTCFTNDLRPRAVHPDGSLKLAGSWTIRETRVQHGASIGANSTIVCGISIGCWAMVGAGSVVTHDVPPFGMVVGNPARLRGFVCPCGSGMRETALCLGGLADIVQMLCQECRATIVLPKATYYLRSGNDTHF